MMTLMEINNSNQLVMKSSCWGITHTFSRHFGRTKTPTASSLELLDCHQKQSMFLLFCQTNWINKTKLARKEPTTRITPQLQSLACQLAGQTLTVFCKPEFLRTELLLQHEGISEVLTENVAWSTQWRPQEGFRHSHSGDVTHADGSRYLVLSLVRINSHKKNSLREVGYDGKRDGQIWTWQSGKI